MPKMIEYRRVPSKSGTQEPEVPVVPSRDYPNERQQVWLKWLAIILGVILLKGLIIHGIIMSMRHSVEGPAHHRAGAFQAPPPSHQPYHFCNRHQGDHGICLRGQPVSWLNQFVKAHRQSQGFTPSHRRANMIFAIVHRARPVAPVDHAEAQALPVATQAGAKEHEEANHDGHDHRGRFRTPVIPPKDGHPVPAFDEALRDAVERAKEALERSEYFRSLAHPDHPHSEDEHHEEEGHDAPKESETHGTENSQDGQKEEEGGEKKQ